MKKVKVLLIDPDKQELSYQEIGTTLADMYNLIGCEYVENPVNYPNGDALYCDEEFWLNYKKEDRRGGFMQPFWRAPIAGKAFIAGTTLDGNMSNCKTDLETLDITWKSPEEIYNYGVSTGLIKR